MDRNRLNARATVEHSKSDHPMETIGSLGPNIGIIQGAPVPRYEGDPSYGFTKSEWIVRGYWAHDW